MNIFHHYHTIVTDIIAKSLPLQSDSDRHTVELTRNPAHGHIAMNAALVYADDAKAIGLTTKDLAQLIVDKLSNFDEIKHVQIAGPGFINVTFNDIFFLRLMRYIMAFNVSYGKGDAILASPDYSWDPRRPGINSNNSKINIEFVSANPTGPLHIGHARGAIVGSALANLLEFAGYEVIREYYINDNGSQIDTLTSSAFLRYQEALGIDIGEIPDGLYPGEYLKPVGQFLAKQFGDSLLVEHIKSNALNEMIYLIKRDLFDLGINFNVFTFESIVANNKHVSDVIGILAVRGLTYYGTLPPPKGHISSYQDDREQFLFKSSLFGDDSDRTLITADDKHTYFVNDIAYHYDKLNRGFKNLINVWGEDHSGYVFRMKAAVKALDDNAKLEVLLCHIVNLKRDGVPVRMSKRNDNFITVREVLDEVGADALRFIMLMRKNDSPMDFDLAKVVQQNKDNPVFYVQYAHARTQSAIKEAKLNIMTCIEQIDDADFSLLTDPNEQRIMMMLAYFPQLINRAALSREPHKIAIYSYDLAALFHSHWANADKFVDPSNIDLTIARVQMLYGISYILKAALGILGVSAPDEM
jgi:arginyl-tRNA synthetase